MGQRTRHGRGTRGSSRSRFTLGASVPSLTERPIAPKTAGRRGRSDRRHSPAHLADTAGVRETAIVGLAVIATLVGGGGGTTYPLAEMIVQSVVAFAAMALVIQRSMAASSSKIPAQAWLIAGLMLVIPVAQLIPLPPSVWHALPDRGIEVQSLGLLGRSDAWMPLTVSPLRTFASLLCIASAALLLLMVSSLSVAQRTWLCLAIAAVGLLSILLGGLQLAAGQSGAWSLYSRHDAGYIVGFQTSRNAETEVLKIALLAAAVSIVGFAKPGASRSQTLILASILAAVGTIAVILTGSRTGIALLPLGLVAYAAIVWPAFGLRWRLRDWAIALGLFLLVAAAGSQVNSLQRVFSRFAVLQDARSEIWEDTVYAAKAVWPAGSGIGTFEIQFERGERLEVVDEKIAAHAHSDWLEWALETGLAGLVVIAAGFAVLIRLGVQAIVRARFGTLTVAERGQMVLAAASLTIIALHAIVDYPMRSMALAGLAAIAAGMLIPQRKMDKATMADGSASEESTAA